ncbi:BTAD domain-containing putative transcriptional regulator [Streptomyces acidiscabies]|uniref:AfsR/SARP family transcriptional regulator n=1 Tax=Streptomyces acidiscabies TaxID=42234 RepID=UPI0038F72279
MIFNVLGPLEVRHGDQLCTPTAQKVRWTLALLLLRADRVVDRTSLIDELWGDEPPRSAVTTLQTYIYQLRKTFGQLLDQAPGATQMILTQPPGYGIRLRRDDQLDLHVFERETKRGRQLLAEEKYEEASQTLADALKLWRGAPLADITQAGRLIEGHIVYLEELQIEAVKLRILAESKLGRYASCIPELRELVSTHPLNEWFHGELIKALARAGRRGEALEAYRDLRRILVAELGLEPSFSHQRLQQQLLLTDDGMTSHSPQAASGRVLLRSEHLRPAGPERQ